MSCCLHLPLAARHSRRPPTHGFRAAARPAGLGDARLAGLQAALAAEAASLAGEMQLGHLCETAIDLLTSANQPEGDCTFCLEPLLLPPGGGGPAPGSAVLRLGCYHCNHM